MVTWLRHIPNKLGKQSEQARNKQEWKVSLANACWKKSACIPGYYNCYYLLAYPPRFYACGLVQCRLQLQQYTAHAS
jgi:hypothetical protein